jgi:hypothetical protein
LEKIEKKRKVPHQDGFYSSFIYFDMSEKCKIFNKICDKLSSILMQNKIDYLKKDNFHISLCKN